MAKHWAAILYALRVSAWDKQQQQVPEFLPQPAKIAKARSRRATIPFLTKPTHRGSDNGRRDNETSQGG
ncbi:MAG: hypothetical protein RH917_00780 [Lacipirellulaceae bacterium]